LKRALDFIFALTGLLVTLPLMIGIAVVAWANHRGPILFGQERIGQGRRPFRMFKFRTMVQNAERDTGPVWSWSGDPRVTRVGKVLRATHLDELPQLWNVLRGEMSLVGPRPERAVFIEKLEKVIPGYAHRLAIRPGITGLSQLHSTTVEPVRTMSSRMITSRPAMPSRGTSERELTCMRTWRSPVRDFSITMQRASGRSSDARTSWTKGSAPMSGAHSTRLFPFAPGETMSEYRK
jgi:lipopolysaccharide/colanic/teichoic acid biosynthesis glycosyltransferase